jgi:ankyrin repeat protein
VIQLNLELCADLEKCVWLLLCMGADIQCKEELSDSTGYSLLHYAVITGNLRRASQLLRQGANVDPQNVSGVTPLMEAAKWGRPECVIVLLKVGGYLERRDKDGNGALHYSGMYGRKQLSRLLLIAGANKAARNFALKTPADLAKKNKQTVTAEQILLYRHSSSIDRDKVG